MNIFLIVTPLTYFDFVQFGKKVGQYHLTYTDIVVIVHLTKARRKYAAHVLIKMVPSYHLRQILETVKHLPLF